MFSIYITTVSQCNKLTAIPVLSLRQENKFSVIGKILKIFFGNYSSILVQANLYSGAGYLCIKYDA